MEAFFVFCPWQTGFVVIVIGEAVGEQSAGADRQRPRTEQPAYGAGDAVKAVRSAGRAKNALCLLSDGLVVTGPRY